MWSITSFTGVARIFPAGGSKCFFSRQPSYSMKYPLNETPHPLTTNKNATHPLRGVHSRPRGGGALATYPLNSAPPPHFFSPWEVHPHPLYPLLATPLTSFKFLKLKYIVTELPGKAIWRSQNAKHLSSPFPLGCFHTSWLVGRGLLLLPNNLISAFRAFNLLFRPSHWHAIRQHSQNPDYETINSTKLWHSCCDALMFDFFLRGHLTDMQSTLLEFVTQTLLPKLHDIKRCCCVAYRQEFNFMLGFATRYLKNAHFAQEYPSCSRTFYGPKQVLFCKWVKTG